MTKIALFAHEEMVYERGIVLSSFTVAFDTQELLIQIQAKPIEESNKESAYHVAAQWVYSGNVPTGQKKKSIHALGTARQLIDQIKTIELAQGQSMGEDPLQGFPLQNQRVSEEILGHHDSFQYYQDDLRNFSMYLVEKKYSASTINKVMVVGKVAISWAYP